MATITKYSCAKRFGTRYGRTLKAKWGKIQSERSKKQVCPYCRKTQVKRVAAGIWFCKKCNSKYTGYAYTVSRRVTFEEEAPEMVEEETKKTAEEES